MSDLKAAISSVTSPIVSSPTPLSREPRASSQNGFDKTLNSILESQNEVSASTRQQAGMSPARLGELKFSGHALERMRSRGIHFSTNEMENIQNAIARAAQKGSKDTLVLAGEKAMIVSVKNNTVVTVMDRAAMKENVFTNIDSTVVI